MSDMSFDLDRVMNSSSQNDEINQKRQNGDMNPRSRPSVYIESLDTKKLTLGVPCVDYHFSNHIFTYQKC